MASKKSAPKKSASKKTASKKIIRKKPATKKAVAKKTKSKAKAAAEDKPVPEIAKEFSPRGLIEIMPISQDCMCKQKKPNGKYFCFKFIQGRWIQTSSVPFPTQEMCEEACC